MQKLLLIILIIFQFKHSSAQITKGNWLVGGTGLFNSTNSNSGNAVRLKTTNIQLAPNIGYFMANKFVSGLKLGFGRTKNESKSPGYLWTTTTYNLGPFVRYYFLSTEKPFNILVDGSYQYGIERLSTANPTANQPLNTAITKYNKNTFAFAAGPVIYFNPAVGLEFLIGYSTEKYIHYEGTNNTFQVGLGLQVHLGKKLKTN